MIVATSMKSTKFAQGLAAVIIFGVHALHTCFVKKRICIHALHACIEKKYVCIHTLATHIAKNHVWMHASLKRMCRGTKAFHTHFGDTHFGKIVDCPYIMEQYGERCTYYLMGIQTIFFLIFVG